LRYTYKPILHFLKGKFKVEKVCMVFNSIVLISKEIKLLPISTRRYARARAKDLISFEQKLKIQ
jgi:hypothetical protein